MKYRCNLICTPTLFTVPNTREADQSFTVWVILNKYLDELHVPHILGTVIVSYST